MEVITLEIDDDGCGQLQFELPADATAEEVAYIESLVPRIETGLLELRDPGPTRWYSVAGPRSLASRC